MTNANDFRGETELEIDGKKRVVKFDHEAIRQLEQRHGAVMQVLHNCAGAPQSLPHSFVLDAVYFGIQHHGDKKITRSKLEKLIPTHRVYTYAGPVLVALLLAFNGPEGTAELLAKDDEDDKAPPAGEAEGDEAENP